VRKELVVLIIAPVVFSAATRTLEAADYFVSPGGSASWSVCVTQDKPCSAPTAMANAVAGDTVYFRGGQYEVGMQDNAWPPHFAWNPAHNGTAGHPITFRNYPGERAVVNGTVSGANSGSWTGYNEIVDVLGAVNRSYITFDGFTVQANNGTKMPQVVVYGDTSPADHVTIRNFVFNGGKQQVNDGNNWQGLFAAHVTGLTVSNCLFYDYWSAANNHNTSAIKLYGTYGTVIENCEIYHCTVGIFPKSMHNDDTMIRNNFIHDCYLSILACWLVSNEYASSDRGIITNNVVVNSSFLGFNAENDYTAIHGNDWVLSNNTLYNVGQAFGLAGNDSGHGWKIYNNLSHNQSVGEIGTAVNVTLAEADHNQWGTGTLQFKMRQYEKDQATYPSLAAWQASTELDGGGHPGANDLASDPKFVNGSGTLTRLADFALASDSPCKGAGRNGADMGADVTTVGYRSTPGSGPAAPKGVVVRVP
jgi:hypothetical protein